MVYRDDDATHDPKPPQPLSGSKAARMRMINRMGGNAGRMDWLESQARLAADRDANQKHPPAYSFRDLERRADAARKPGEGGGSAAARQRMLAGIKERWVAAGGRPS